MENTRSAAILWWTQRLLSIVLIPLFIWFIAGLAQLIMASEEPTTILQIVQQFSTEGKYALLFLSLVLFPHIYLGLEEVIEDYVHNEKTKLLSLILFRIFTIRMLNDVIVYLM